MNTPILILEDDLIQRKSLEALIREYSTALEPISVTSLDRAKDELNHFAHFSAFFIDISLESHISNTDGLQFAKHILLTPKHKDTPIIFVTGYPEHVFHAINEFHCYAYLLKPFKREDVFQQLDRIFKTDSSLRLRTLSGIYQKIDYNDIFYIQSFGRNIHYQTRYGEIRSRQYTLKTLEDILPGFFSRCHKSYIVNTNHIVSFNATKRVLYIREIDEQIPYNQNYHVTL